MKLDPRPRNLFIRPAEVLQKPEQVTEVDFFDPRVNTSAELERFKRIPEHPTSDECYAIEKVTWIGWFNPEFRERLRSCPEFREFAEGHIERTLAVSLVEGQLSITYAMKIVADLFQIFPEFKPQFQTQINEAYGSYITKIAGRAPISFFQSYTPIVCQLWPDKKAEFMREFFPTGVEKFLKDRVNQGNLLPVQWTLLQKCMMGAGVCLAFPEYTEQVRQELAPYLPRMLQDLKKRQGLDPKSPSFEKYQDELSNLTVVGAERAWIDETGQIQIKLQPLTKLGQPIELPPRPQL